MDNGSDVLLSSASFSMNQPIATIDRIYTDGACSGNPGPGGWGTVVYFADGGVQELGGGDRGRTTNNRMEMQATIAGLEYYQASGQKEGVVLYTDSQYVINGITKWISGWKKKGWKSSTGKAVLNQDLWEELDALNSRKIEWRYVRGHSGDEGNERCDRIAVAYSHGTPIALKQYSASAIKSVVKTEAIPEAKPDSKPQVQPEVETEAEAEAKPIVAKIVKESPAVTQKNVTPKSEFDMQVLTEAMERLRFADEAAKGNYLLTTEELAIVVQIPAKTIGLKKEDWVWRSWLISRVRDENDQTLWQLERTEDF
jgi:ribonuclease HI